MVVVARIRREGVTKLTLGHASELELAIDGAGRAVGLSAYKFKSLQSPIYVPRIHVLSGSLSI